MIYGVDVLVTQRGYLPYTTNITLYNTFNVNLSTIVLTPHYIPITMSLHIQGPTPVVNASIALSCQCED
jgi:hypothetical protein